MTNKMVDVILAAYLKLEVTESSKMQLYSSVLSVSLQLDSRPASSRSDHGEQKQIASDQFTGWRMALHVHL